MITPIFFQLCFCSHFNFGWDLDKLAIMLAFIWLASVKFRIWFRLDFTFASLAQSPLLLNHSAFSRALLVLLFGDFRGILMTLDIGPPSLKH